MFHRAPEQVLGAVLACLVFAAVAIAAPPVITTSSPLPTSSIGRCYSFALSATGGLPPYYWSGVGTVPAGIQISRAGSVEACTFTQAGTHTFNVRVMDVQEQSSQKTFALTVAPRPMITSPTAPSELPKGTVGVPYRYQLTASGGLAPLTWGGRYVNYRPPTGLSLSSDGVLSGTPAAAVRSAPIEVTLSDSGYGTPPIGGFYTVVLTIEAAASGPVITSLNPASAPAGGEAFTLAVYGSGFVSNSVVQWNDTALPTHFVGNTLLTAAVPASSLASTSPASIRVVNPGGLISAPMTFEILSPAISSLAPPSASAGGAAFTLTVNGANFAAGATVTWNGTPLATTFLGAGQVRAVVPQNLIASQGVASVAVVNPGNYRSSAVSFTIGAPAPTVVTTTLPDGTVGVRYQQQLSATGGTPPYVGWSAVIPDACVLIAGYFCRLPDGVTLSASGALEGVPTRSGTFAFGATVRDSAGGVSAVASLKINIAATALSISATPPPAGTAGTPYSFKLEPSGGVPPYSGWTVTSGTLPPGLSIDAATGVISGTPSSSSGSPFRFSVTVRDSSGSVSAPASFAIEIGAAGPLPPLTVGPQELYFSYRIGSSPPAPATLSVFSGEVSRQFQAQATFAPWLTVSPTQGTTPATIAVSVNPAGLTAGTYRGEIRVSSDNTEPATRIARVTLAVEQAPAPSLTISPSQVTVAAVEGGATVQRQLQVMNPGGGVVNFAGEVRVQAGERWLSLDPAAGSASTEMSGRVMLTVSPAGLRPGTYSAEVRIRGLNVSLERTATVILAVAAASRPRVMVLSQTGFEFVAAAGAAGPLPAQFAVLSAGQPTADFRLETRTLAGGPDWLQARPGAASGTVSVSVQSQALAPGRYFGSVLVVSDAAANSPQAVSVGLTVLGFGTAAPLMVSPAGIGLAVPGASEQTLTLTNLSASPLTFNTTASTADGANWLSLSPARGSITPGQSVRVTVRADAPALADGFRRGTIRVASSDGSVTSVDVLLVVATAALKAGAGIPRSACAPKQFAVLVRSPEKDFRARALEPVNVRAEIWDNCAQRVTQSVVQMASTQTETVDMVHEGNGVWSRTWVPRRQQAPTTLSVSAFIPQALAAAATDIPGVVLAGSGGGVADRVLNSASFTGPGIVSPGSWVSIFGEGLAGASSVAQAAPFPGELAGTQVRIGSRALPLYYVSDRQVNALIPFALNPNSELQLEIQRGSTLSVPIDVVVAGRQPAIFTMNQQGTGQGAILLASDALLAAPESSSPPSRPARPGEYIMIFGTGLGQVANPPADGAVGAANPLILPPRVEIGGILASINFAGLAPGLVGVYQVNAMIPNGVATGDAVEVVLIVDDARSNPATIAIR